MKRRHVIFATFFLAAVATALLVCWPSHEPAHQGKRLSQWLDDFDGSGSPQETVAKDAIRQMGTQALPALVGLLGRTDVPLKKKMASWLERQTLVSIRFTWAETRRAQAARAIVVIGPAAKPVVPDLIRLLAEDGVRNDAAAALSGIGPSVIPALTNVLGHPDEEVRAAAVQVIGAIAQDSAVAVAALLRLLNDPSLSVRGCTAMALGQFGREAQPAIPKLTDMLTIDGVTARAAAFGLAGIGADAWLPVIAALTNSQRQARIGAIGILASYEWKRSPQTSGHSPLEDYGRMQRVLTLRTITADMTGFADQTAHGLTKAEPGLRVLATNSNPEVAHAAANALRDLEKWRQENPTPPTGVGHPAPRRNPSSPD